MMRRESPATRHIDTNNPGFFPPSPPSPPSVSSPPMFVRIYTTNYPYLSLIFPSLQSMFILLPHLVLPATYLHYLLSPSM